MKCPTRKQNWTALSAVVLGLALSAASSRAEEPVPPVPVPPDAPAVDKPVTTSPLDVDYVFDDNGRRDPFTFTKNIALLQTQDTAVNVDANAEKSDLVPIEIINKKRNAAELACNTAEAYLMELDANNAITKCEQGMEEFKDVPELFKYPELEVVKGRLLRARKAGETLRSRQTAQRDFDAMKIQITGVMALPKNSQAIINNEIVHKGSMVKASSESADVMVDEILPERVVFVFRGYRMMLLLSDAGVR